MQYLKQSTSATVKMGPFLDSTNGNDTEEALTISQADIRLSKNGGAFAQTNNAAGASHDENGWYGVPLDTTDTATLGRLTVGIHEPGALAVWETFHVVPANVYDSLFSTDKLQVDLIQIGGDAQSATDLKDFADAGYDPGTNKVQGVVLVDTTTANSDMVGTNGANTTVPDAAGTAAGLHGTTDGKVDVVDANVDSILVDTNDLQTNQGNWLTAVGFSTHSAANVWAVGSRTLTSFGTLVQDIWDKATSALTTVGSIGKLLVDNINATISSRQPSGAVDLNADQSGVTIGTCNTNTDMRGTDGANTTTPDASGTAAGLHTTTDTNVDANETKIDSIIAKLPTNYVMGSSGQTDKDDEIDAIKAKTDNLPAAPAATGDIPTAAANADAVWDEDVVSAHDEETSNGKKAATKLMNIFRRLYKKVEQTNSTQKVYKNDNSTELASMSSSDDGTTQTKGGVSE